MARALRVISWFFLYSKNPGVSPPLPQTNNKHQRSRSTNSSTAGPAPLLLTQTTIQYIMRVYSSTVAILASISLQIPSSLGFVPSRVATSRVNNSHDVIIDVQQPSLLHTNNIRSLQQRRVLYSTSTEESDTVTATKKKKKKKLGLITFDLDDTLYPIAPVLDEANTAFSTAMSNFGYVDIQPSDIVEAGKQIRAQISPKDDGADGSDPLKPSTVNHKEIRLAAIRKEMEEFILKTKLRQTAEDWATEIDSLTTPVRKSAEK